MSRKEIRGALSRQWQESRARWQNPNFADDPFTVRFILGLVIVLIVISMLFTWFAVPFHVSLIGKGELSKKQATLYSIKFNSFNPDIGEAEATVHAGPNLSSYSAIANVENKLCFVSPMKITDLSENIFLSGIHPDFLSKAEEWSVYSASSSQYPWKKEETQKITFKMLGNLARYPFDRYLIVGNIDQMIGYEPAGREPLSTHLVADSIEVDFNIPGYDAKKISEHDLGNWVHAGRGKQTEQEEQFDKEMFGNPKAYWDEHVFYFEVERPSLFRALAALMGVVALISIVAVTVKTAPSEMAKTLAASLVALWGLRNILGTSGPKIPTILDYGVLLLFVLQLSIVAYRLLVRPVNTEAEDPVPDA